MRPSEMAQHSFSMASSMNAPAAKDMPGELQNTLHFMLDGLMSMNTGLRATYMKLEQIERQLKQLKK